MPFDEAIPRTCVVLNGRGFVGRSLVLRLLELGQCIVRVTDSTQSLQLDPSESNSLLSDSLSSGRAEYHQVDVRDISQIKKVLEGASTVFYMDATDLNTDDFYNCYMIIVQGAKNVVTACREWKVRRLVYNSTADVVFDGSHDIHNGDETLTCRWKFQDLMCDLKAQAEALVLFANNIDGLLTCALRPSNVFGPGDTQLVPLLVNLAKPGWTKFIIGSGENMSDFTYVENVAHAHVCAAEALDSRMVSVAGMAFFITNLEPIKFWDFLSIILEGLGYQRYTIRYGKKNTRKGILAASPFPILEFTSMISQLLLWKFELSDILLMPVMVVHSAGSAVADILLWKDEKKTFTYFLVLVLLFYWFFLGGSTLTSSAAKFLLLLSAVLFGYGILPSNIFGFNVKRISPSCFELSETVIKDSIARIAFLWNMGFRNIRLLAKGDDWNTFFKVAGSLYLSKLMLQSFTWSIGLALVFAFTAFFVYEQYEPEIDGLAKFLFNYLKKSKVSLIRNVPAPVVSFLYDCKILHEHKAPAEGNDRKRLQ
ncbi:3beta-hydroxysteroid-dehydrogenase/decarboxylase isoform 3 [Citrus sinensis]|uniref:3beta-hydroxysteroid-dehydrogenase/decarboxylase isoform 3 n=1 Tax=Citrus sinensis TaxID=2711 RepID=A0ACB8MCK6_CITSI|nr:3beta-hydroxysteroid-dehydrogenase/decarboxylase isoform 3 [Citrus sinensis]